jgi:hypothetical protein
MGRNVEAKGGTLAPTQHHPVRQPPTRGRRFRPRRCGRGCRHGRFHSLAHEVTCGAAAVRPQLTHPEFREELQEVFDEVLASLPDEAAPAGRLEVEAMRRSAKAQARAFWT